MFNYLDSVFHFAPHHQHGRDPYAHAGIASVQPPIAPLHLEAEPARAPLDLGFRYGPGLSGTVREKRQVYKTPVFDIVPKRPLVAVRPDTSIEAALRIMADENITSLPVYNHTGDHSSAGSPTSAGFLGIVNLQDIVEFAVFGIAEGDPLMRVDLANLDKLLHPVSGLIGTTEESKSDWSTKSYDVDQLLEDVMYPYTVGVHRVLVYDKKTQSDYAMSQTDVVRFLYNCPDTDTKIINSTIQDLGLGSKEVVSVEDTTTALLAYKKMSMREVSSIAVLDSHGSIVANLSLSDLRGLNRDNFPDLGEPVLTYLRLKHKGEVRPPATVDASHTLYEVMGIMLGLQVHRVWIVDGEGRPVSQVSMTDVIRQFAPKDFKWPTP